MTQSAKWLRLLTLFIEDKELKTEIFHLLLAVIAAGLAVFGSSFAAALLSVVSLWVYVYFAHNATHLGSWLYWLETFNKHTPEANAMIGDYFKR
jgi:hypothetical protein